MADAYRRCEEITRAEARNFYYGIRLLPPGKRMAMSAVYALARRIDDVGDGDLPPAEKLAALGKLHESVDALEAGLVDQGDPVFVALAHASTEFAIRMEAFHEIVEGCEQDSEGREYERMDDTISYCRLVAGSVGRISLSIFGVKRRVGVAAGRLAEETNSLADDLGVALQLTNILRDIREDQALGRVYLPAQYWERFGLRPGCLEPAEGLAEMIGFTAGEAVGWFERGLRLLDYLDHRSRACTAAMAGIYRRVVERIRVDPVAPLSGRVSLPAREKALVAARSLLGLRP